MNTGDYLQLPRIRLSWILKKVGCFTQRLPPFAFPGMGLFFSICSLLANKLNFHLAFSQINSPSWWRRKAFVLAAMRFELCHGQYNRALNYHLKVSAVYQFFRQPPASPLTLLKWSAKIAFFVFLFRAKNIPKFSNPHQSPGQDQRPLQDNPERRSLAGIRMFFTNISPL